MEEISLSALFSLIKKGKKIILIVTCSFVLAAVVLNMVTYKPAYSGKALLLPPKIGNTYIFSALETKSIIESQAFMEKISERMNLGLTVSSKNISAKFLTNTNYVEVQYNCNDRSGIDSFFGSLLEVLGGFAESEYTGKTEALRLYMESLSKRKQLAEKELENLSININKISQEVNKDTVDYLALSMSQNAYYSCLNSLIQMEEEMLSNRLTLLSARNFSYLSGPQISSENNQMTTLLNILAAGIAGLLFSFVLVLIMNSLHEKSIS